MRRIATLLALTALPSSTLVAQEAPAPPPLVLHEETLEAAPAAAPLAVAAAAFSIASSLKTLFGGGGGDNRGIKRRLDQLIAQNNQILQTLGQIVGILNNLGVTVRESVRYELIFDKQAALLSESQQLYEMWSAELLDRNARRLAAQRYQNDILPDVRDLTRQLMDEGYGFAPADTVGQGMLMEFWMSSRLGERRAYRREIGSTYVAYFDRTLDPALPGSPAKALSEAVAQRDRLRAILDAADARIGADGWTEETFRGTRSRVDGRTTYYTDYRVLQTARGNRNDGYSVTVREEILRERSYREPSEGCIRCRQFEMFALTDPADPGDSRPAGRVAYWNQVRQAWLSAVEAADVLTQVNQTLGLYREQAEAVRVNG